MTYVYTQLNAYDIARDLSNDEYASWHKNYDACLALAEFLEESATEFSGPIELDAVALRCEFSLMNDIADYNKQYSHNCRDIEEIREFTTVIEIPNSDSFIIQDY